MVLVFAVMQLYTIFFLLLLSHATDLNRFQTFSLHCNFMPVFFLFHFFFFRDLKLFHAIAVLRWRVWGIWDRFLSVQLLCHRIFFLGIWECFMRLQYYAIDFEGFETVPRHCNCMAELLRNLWVFHATAILCQIFWGIWDISCHCHIMPEILRDLRQFYAIATSFLRFFFGGIWDSFIPWRPHTRDFVELESPGFWGTSDSFMPLRIWLEIPRTFSPCYTNTVLCLAKK